MLQKCAKLRLIKINMEDQTLPKATCQGCGSVWTIDKCHKFEWTDRLFCRACSGICELNKSDLEDWIERNYQEDDLDEPGEVEEKEEEGEELSDTPPGIDKPLPEEKELMFNPNDFEWDIIPED
jgi:hypothetical protein